MINDENALARLIATAHLHISQAHKVPTRSSNVLLPGKIVASMVDTLSSFQLPIDLGCDNLRPTNGTTDGLVGCSNSHHDGTFSNYTKIVNVNVKWKHSKAVGVRCKRSSEHVKRTHHSRLKFLILFLPVELQKRMCNKCNEWIAIESFGQLHLLYFMNFSIFQFQRNSMTLVHKPVCLFINIVRNECKVMTKI